MPSVTMFSQSKLIADANDGRKIAMERRGLGVEKAGRMVANRLKDRGTLKES